MSGYPPGYVPQAYPKWKYNAALPPVIVNDPTAEAALGAGWYDSPNFPSEPELTDPAYNPSAEN